MKRRAAIIGGGVIGRGWAARFLLHGWDVAIFDPDPDTGRKMGDVLEATRRSLPMLYETVLPEEGAMRLAGTIAEAVAGADYVQESVPERLHLKRAVYAEIEAANRAAPLGSSTAGFKPSELGEGLDTRGRLFVAHPFNPVYLLPLVELVPGAAEPQVVDAASDMLTSVGFRPLRLDAGSEAHIANRLQQAVWREALWLVHDDMATTEQIDEAIRLGVGLNWAQMGLFETGRSAGGAGGMAQVIEQVGQALKTPPTKRADVPEITADFAARVAAQSDAQSGALGARDLERLRDRNLVAILRALKREGSGAGAVISAQEGPIRPADPEVVPMVSLRRVVPSDWTDYNGHMNESRYGQVFSDAADAVLAHVGADAEYVAQGNSFFTAETKVNYVLETHAGETIRCDTRVLMVEGKKLKLFHEMRRDADRELLATCEQFLLHVSLETRKSCAPQPDVLARLEALAVTHAD